MKNLQQPIYDAKLIESIRAKNRIKGLWMHSMERDINYPNPGTVWPVMLIIGAGAAIIVWLMCLLIPGLI